MRERVPEALRWSLPRVRALDKGTRMGVVRDHRLR